MATFEVTRIISECVTVEDAEDEEDALKKAKDSSEEDWNQGLVECVFVTEQLD